METRSHSELDRARAMLARCEAKAAAATDAAVKFYYDKCAEGWRRAVQAAEKGGATEPNTRQ